VATAVAVSYSVPAGGALRAGLFDAGLAGAVTLANTAPTGILGSNAAAVSGSVLLNDVVPTGTVEGALPPEFDSVDLVASQANPPSAAANKIVILNLHASGGDPTGSGLLYEAACSGQLAYSTSTTWRFALQGKTDSQTALAPGMQIRPLDRAGTYPDSAVRQSYHMGWVVDFGTGAVALRLASERRMETLMRWVDDNVAGLHPTKRCATGDSMGAWGSLRFAIRRPDLFAAVYPDRPIWRWNATGRFQAPRWDINSAALYDPGTTPPLSAVDGSGTLQSHMDLIAYVQSGAPIPWIGWCVGREDGFMAFSDHVAAVVALRARRAGFAFVWNNGNHSTGSILAQIINSYPFGLFELGKGYPRFENCSLDEDPAVDLEGGINVGLTFRNVVESATGWSCEVTHISSACTVDVSPISPIYPNGNTVMPITVTIPAANSWVPVSFGS